MNQYTKIYVVVQAMLDLLEMEAILCTEQHKQIFIDILWSFLPVLCDTDDLKTIERIKESMLKEEEPD